ncbi:MAG: CCA tRNA nucleotidyltransferase [Eubacteriales bacterium]|nr:CCA tRNA nucleotidyltransferase [Eubacteriales bacterium]
MTLEIPSKVEQILHILENNGYEAYAVGGCVRDSVLGRTPDDWDITTSAKPEQVKALFRRTVDTGLQHGTVTVLMDKEGFEVTTYRVDGEYEDARHPKEVTFTASLEEDLKRRDFTINAMAYNPVRGIVDLFDGMEDLKKGVIRCVGNPRERFTEDALRILRAVRFSAQLGFQIEERTRDALRVLAPNLEHVSAERIQVELVKLLISPHPDYFRIVWEEGITGVFLPEWDACMECAQNTPHHCYTVGEHILHSLLNIRADKVLRLTMLLHDIGKPVVKKTDENGRDHFKMHGPESEKMAHTILRRLKFDNDTIHKVCRLIKWHDYRPIPEPKYVRRAVNRIGEDIFPLYLEVQEADMLAQSTYRREEKLARIQGVAACFHEIQESGQCVSLKTLALSGRDLIRAGYAPGPEIGEILNGLLEHVLDHPGDNTKEKLLTLLPPTEDSPTVSVHQS